MTKALLTHFLLALALGMPTSVFSEQISAISVKTTGSVPEVPGLYDCIWNLKGQDYSPQKLETCAQSISQTKYFASVRTKKRFLGNDKISVRFLLESRKLPIRELRIEADPSDQDRIQSWLTEDSNTLREGQTYERWREVETKNEVAMYFRSKGRQVGVSSIVRLDYIAGSSSVIFRVTEGPHIPSEPVSLLHQNKCRNVVGALDWSDIDQYTPIPLLEDMVSLRSSGVCFSSDAIPSDKSALEESGLFESVTLTSSGDPHRPQITLKLRTKRLTIGKIQLRFFGLSEEEGSRGTPPIPLRLGDVYVRAAAAKCEDILKKTFPAPEKIVDISEREEVTSDHLLNVYFDVFRYPRDQLIINGRQIMPAVETTAIDGSTNGMP
jgi:hypothetical protein